MNVPSCSLIAQTVEGFAIFSDMFIFGGFEAQEWSICFFL